MSVNTEKTIENQVRNSPKVVLRSSATSFVYKVYWNSNKNVSNVPVDKWYYVCFKTQNHNIQAV